MKKFTLFAVIGALLSVAAACSSAPAPDGGNVAVVTASPTAPHGAKETGATEETPAAVKAAFPDAQSFTKQHKDIPTAKIAEIEKEAGGKLPDTDHHSYLAFTNAGGARKQIGAATVVNAAGKEMVVVYGNKEGSPVINEVRAEGLPAAFLAQFKGKGHDDKLSGLKTGDANEKAAATAIWTDLLTMQALYGAAHTH